MAAFYLQSNVIRILVHLSVCPSFLPSFLLLLFFSPSFLFLPLFLPFPSFSFVPSVPSMFLPFPSTLRYKKRSHTWLGKCLIAKFDDNILEQVGLFLLPDRSQMSQEKNVAICCCLNLQKSLTSLPARQEEQGSWLCFYCASVLHRVFIIICGKLILL